MFKKIAIPEEFYTIWEAFLSLLPIALTMNIIIMGSEIQHLFQDPAVGHTDFIDGHGLNFLYSFLLPLFFNIAFSHLLAKAKQLEPISTSLIAMVCFLISSDFLYVDEDTIVGSSANGSIFSSIILTWLAVRLLQYCVSIKQLKIIKKPTSVISPLLTKNINLLLPGLLTILCFEMLGTLLQTLSPQFVPVLTQYLPDATSLSGFHRLALYKVIALGSWLVGMHGEKFSDGLLASVYGFPMLRAPGENALDNFHSLFMNIGGSGSTFVIAFLILLNKQLVPLRELGRISAFFSLFNINEILLFGIPIVLNPVFILPFFLAPFANMLIGLFMLDQGMFDIQPISITWMTPPLLNAYLISGGSLWAVLTQIFCLVVDSCIYWPFLILASRQSQAPIALRNIFSDENYGYLGRVLDNKQEEFFTVQQSKTLRKLTRTQQVATELKNSRLAIYYQAKVDAQTQAVSGFEALLRLQNRQGKVYEPAFLSVLYQQGLSKFMDKRVIDLVFDHILHWRKLSFQIPPISLNLNKDFLCDPKAVQRFIQQAQSHQVVFTIEITEHTYTMELATIAQAVQQLRQAGHRVVIDHFGTGYAALRTLVDLAAHEIKIDRGIIDIPYRKQAQGQLLLESTVQLCHSLGFQVSVEGINTQEQLRKAQTCGVDFLQGDYFGKPISHKKMEVFLANPAYEAAT